jgi:hypothetical protein
MVAATQAGGAVADGTLVGRLRLEELADCLQDALDGTGLHQDRVALSAKIE